MKPILIVAVSLLTIHISFSQTLDNLPLIKKADAVRLGSPTHPVSSNVYAKGTNTHARYIAYSIYNGGTFNDTGRYFFSGTRNGALPILSQDLINPIGVDNYGKAFVPVDSELNWGTSALGLSGLLSYFSASYNSANYVTTATLHRYDLSIYERKDFTYNTANEVVKIRIYDTLISGNSLQPAREVYPTYDVQGHIVFDSTYNVAINQPTSKTYRTYNSAGRISSEKTYQKSGNSWTLVDSVSITYNSNNLPDKYVRLTYSSGIPYSGNKDSMVYQGTNPLYTYKKAWTYDNYTQKWVNNSIDTYHIAGFGNNYDTLNVQVWHDAFNSYQQYVKIVGVFNSDNTLDTAYWYTPASTVPFRFVRYFYEHYSDPAAVKEIQDKGRIMPYPNPAHAQLSFAGLNSPAVVTILNLEGKVLIRQGIKGKDVVDIRQLVPGSYIVTVTSEYERKSYSFIKE